jgi:hypothetical protein
LASALTLLFQWRPYREFFDGRAVKTVVDPAQEKPRPAVNLAWISAKVIAKEAKGDIKIYIVKINPPYLPADLETELAGVIVDRCNDKPQVQPTKGVMP